MTCECNMKLYYQDPSVTIYQGDCRGMSEIPDNSVQCFITSPPYWGLRKYAGEQELVWGDNHCEHEWGPQLKDSRHDHTWASSSPIENRPQTQYIEVVKGQYCPLCGAWKGAYGLEPTPEMYVQHTVEILREIRRVLRKDGVVFWNIGDSYASTPRLSRKGSTMVGTTVSQDASKGLPKRDFSGLKPKDLCLIPFRVAIAAQEDGWWVRSVIIWSKPNPMPESVTDRPTESHEYILMLTKSAKYYWDQDAVREPFLPQSLNRISQHLDTQHGGPKEAAFMNDSIIPGGGDRKRHSQILKRLKGSMEQGLTGRNIRSVWEFPTQPYPEAHFAVFPEALPEKCIMAATKQGDTVLDSFAGSGTVGEIAKKLNRKAILIDISEEYCELARKRLEAVPMPMELGV